jgi:hypothetical protein
MVPWTVITLEPFSPDSSLNNKFSASFVQKHQKDVGKVELSVMFSPSLAPSLGALIAYRRATGQNHCVTRHLFAPDGM